MVLAEMAGWPGPLDGRVTLLESSSGTRYHSRTFEVSSRLHRYHKQRGYGRCRRKKKNGGRGYLQCASKNCPALYR